MSTRYNFHELKARALKGARPAGEATESPLPPIVQGIAAQSAEVTPAPSKKKRERTHKAATVAQSEPEDGQGGKRTRTSSDCSHLPNIELENLSAADIEFIKRKPLQGPAAICNAASDLIYKLQRGDGEASVELRKERDDLQSKLQKAQTALESVRSEASLLEAAKKKAEAALAQSNGKVYEASLQIEKLEGSIGKLNQENKDLKLEVESTKRAKEEAERAKEEVIEDMRVLTLETVEIAQNQFQNALNQIGVRYPDLEIDPEVISDDHEVLGAEIVKVGGRAGSTLVVYPKPGP